MTAEACEAARGLVALEVVGQLGEAERVALVAHIDGCPSCREERRDLLTLAAVLPAGDPAHLAEPEVPFSLRAAVLGRLRAEARRHRRTRGTRLVLGAVAAVALAAVVLVLTLAGPSGPVTTTVALRGLPGVHATMRLTAEPWGTAMELRESGQRPGEVLSVATRTASGAWWPTGTYRTVGSSVRVTMACALKLDDITGVWIRDHAGAVVLHGMVQSYSD